MSAAARPSLTFLGGVGTVTGSKFLIESAESGVLIDCGLFQGLSSLRRRNWERPAVRLDRLNAVVLTHAHMDHTGYLPALAKAGWAGPVYCTEATTLLAAIVLTDSAHLMQEEAQLANEQGWSKHSPALPLYTPEDVERVRALFTPVPFGVETEIAQDVPLTLGRAGHILGSSWARLDVDSHSILSSGDLGRPSHPLLLPPDPRPKVDTLLLESTYGDRSHSTLDPVERLSEVINRTTA
jgi:metallo-beta-lactamase family protein